MAPKILAVFGATGNQGGSVINHVLSTPSLSKTFTLRGITRDTSSAASQALSARGVEMVSADFSSVDSLTAALSNAHTVFSMTNTIYDGNTGPRERTYGRAIADASVAAGVHYLIFSTLPSISSISGGKYTKVEGFDVKAEVEQYIRSLPIKSAFFAPSGFMANYTTHMAPRPAPDGATDEHGNPIYVIANVMRPDSVAPQLDIEHDTGKYVAAILENPDKYEGQVLAAATELYTQAGIAESLSKQTGRTVVYKQLPVEVWKQFLPPLAADMMAEMFLYIDEFGYYGPKTKELVEQTVQSVATKLTTFDEFLALSQFKLD